MELHLRRRRRGSRSGLAKCHPGGSTLGRFALRPADCRPLLLPIEALRHRGDGVPRRRLVRTHLRAHARRRRASPAPLRRRGLPRDGLGERRAGGLPRGRTHAVLRGRYACTHGRRQHHRSAGRRPESRRDHPAGEAVLEGGVGGDLLHPHDRDLADGLARACRPPPHRYSPPDPRRRRRQRRVSKSPSQASNRG